MFASGKVLSCRQRHSDFRIESVWNFYWEKMSTFIDLYEIMQVDQTADQQEIEDQFIALGQKFHPDVPETGSQEQFDLLMQAFQVLRIPESREKYDDLYLEHHGGVGAIGRDEVPADATLENLDLDKEANDRVLLMRKFYERRRSDSRNPGLAFGSLDGVVECSRTMLDFHLWYFQKKNWLFREEGGTLTITAEGVDHVESGIKEHADSMVSMS